jgi:hypothetical protein
MHCFARCIQVYVIFDLELQTCSHSIVKVLSWLNNADSDMRVENTVCDAGNLLSLSICNATIRPGDIDSVQRSVSPSSLH